MKKRDRIYSAIIAAAAGLVTGLLLASCKPAASGQFGTLVLSIAGGNERAIGTNGLPELNSSVITFTVTKTGGSLIKEQTYRPDEPKTCTVTLPVGEKITVRVRLTNASAEWVGTTEHTVKAGSNPVSVKLRKKAAALHSFVFSTHRNGSTPGTASFTLKLKGQNDSLHDLLTTPLTEKTHPYFVRDSKGSIYLVYAEPPSPASNAIAWKMRVYDSEGKNPKQIELPNAGKFAFVPAADFTTGRIYAASAASQGKLYRLDGDAFTNHAFLHCTEKYAVGNNRLVYIERTADPVSQQQDRFSLKLYADISQSFQNPDQPVQVSAEKDITEDIRITGSTQPQITDICIHGDYVYLLFSAGQSDTGRFYRIGGLVRYKLTQESAGITIGDAERFGFEKTLHFKELTIPNLTDAKAAVLENYGYETRFYAPVRFIGFDAENLYIADDGIAFTPTEGIVLPIKAEDRDRIAVFNTAEASLSFDSVPQGTAWFAYADESIYAKVPYTDLARYLATEASATSINHIEITGSIPIAHFEGTGTNPGELGKKIKDASSKKIVLKLPESVIGLTDMSYCFNQCANLVSVRNIPDSVTNMSNCFNRCSSLVEAPAIPVSVMNMSECFKSCKNVTKAPDIPATVTEMRGCFQFCEKLTHAPVIPANVTNMQSCFYGCTALTQAPVIPASVTNMQSCFFGCTALTKAPAIPANVTNMSNCFYGCTALTKAPAIPPDSQLTNMSSCFDQCTALTEAPLIPARVTDMSGCFNGCTALTKAPAIPDGITNMSSCFFNCTALTKGPDIPASVKVMRLCFSGCTRMEGVTLDCNYNSGSSSGSPDFQGVFAGCTALQDGGIQVKTAHYAAYTDINALSMMGVPGSTPDEQKAKFTAIVSVAYTDLANYLTTQASATHVNYIEITGDIPIADFKGTGTDPGQLGQKIKAASPKKIVLKLPEGLSGVTDMKSCFKNCTNLVSIQNIPDGVTNMSNCFHGCSSLVEAPAIPASVMNMSECFESCARLTKAPDIPASVTDMTLCFQDCTALTKAPAIPPDSHLTNMSSCFNQCTALTEAPLIPARVTDMSGCFSGCTALTQAPVIPDGVTNMSSCFFNCSTLTKGPVIPASVTDMSGCFSGCTKLTQAPVIPDSVENMKECFYGCTALTKGPDIPASITDMSFCFQGCIKLEGITLHRAYNPNGTLAFSNAFSDCDALTAGSIRVKAEHYADYTLHADIYGIGVNREKFTGVIAYENIHKLKDYLATAPDDAENRIEITGTIPAAHFRGISSEVGKLGNTIKAASPKKIALILPKGLSGVTDMKSCFKTCTNLVSVENIPDGVTNMSNCFDGCSSLVEAPAIPASVTDILLCFQDCTALTKPPVIPPDSQLTNMAVCFDGCIALTEAPLIPANVTDMSLCFNGCTALAQGPDIPASVTDMHYCFQSCTNLRKVKITCPYNPAAQAFKDVFTGCGNLLNGGIQVKAEHYNAYTGTNALINMDVPGSTPDEKKAKFKKVD